MARPKKTTTAKTTTDKLLNSPANKKRLLESMEGLKFDENKPRMDLIPPYMEEETAKVYTFGAEKYGPNNWRLVKDHEARYIAAAMRHINAMRKGEAVDPESGLLHAAHAICCLTFIGETILEEHDDGLKKLHKLMSS